MLKSFIEISLNEMTYQELRDLTINEIHALVKKLKRQLPQEYKDIIDELEPDMYEDLIAEIAYDGGLKGKRFVNLKIPKRILDRYADYF
ncbi:hypothetical protein [Vibrio phage XZ1]|uniref:Uncharacterized protein n=3 Tax=Schizotequatrovirus TaxID=1198137 RepID=A0A0D4DB65_9CAUD|nr:hypothetical protein AVU32_gp215 [Vibrio phage ValKK3]QBX06042.1 hypothetical protein Va3_088 [Vibrio phage Va3]QNJ54667.1 hypothetical protein vBValMR10Z_126 [Vibrio phage vB_ValM_R10Z]QNJ55053.1 hypothetical protein vBValMR11Z_127 [Vibrio phage vB_ValM_R11Z]UOL51443.1 hypothetical protein [Vibrio phage XZ1]URQ03631.1 hypothetical protein PVA23_254 [Vibrio phage PVA23]